MEIELHIRACVPQQILPYKEKFYINQGYGIVELTPYGDYSLNVVGLTETVARRSNEYKCAFKKVSMDMLHAYEAATGIYTCLHWNTPSIEPVVMLQNELTNLTPQKYQRGSFTLSKPTKKEVEKNLLDEAKNINFDKTNINGHVDKKTFVMEHLDEMVGARQQAWQEAYNLFNMIEDAREERENAKFLAAFKALHNSKKAHFEGKEDTVKQELSNLCGNISVPYNLEISFTYSRTSHVLETSVIIVDGISVPTSKASILASGKISVKNKSISERITDKTNSAVSLIYFLAGNLFNVSPQIQHLRISLCERNCQNSLLWVEFEREKFSRSIPKGVDVLTDILRYPNVLKLKYKTDTIELCVMDKTTFDKDVALAIQHANDVQPQSQPTYADLGDNNIAISFDEANLLCGVPNLANEVRKAISIAKDNGQTCVIVDKKMINTLNELNSEISAKGWLDSHDTDNHHELAPVDEISNGGDSRGNLSSENLDPLFEEAARLIVANQQGSTSLIQRKTSIDYKRAANLMEQLEHAGIVGPLHGSRPREVLVSDEATLKAKLQVLLKR